MLYALFTIACLCGSVNNDKINNKSPDSKKQATTIQKLLNEPMHYKISEKVKYFKVPTRWERT